LSIFALIVAKSDLLLFLSVSAAPIGKISGFAISLGKIETGTGKEGASLTSLFGNVSYNFLF